MDLKLRFLILSSLLCCVSECAKILAILPCSSRSHHIWNKVLLEGLADNGHQVTALTPFSEPDKPNLHYSFLNYEPTIDSKLKSSLLDRAYFSPRQHADAFFQCCFDLCKHLLHSAGTEEVLKLKGDIDLLILESFGFECFFGFMHYFNNVPVIGVSAHGHTPWNSQQMGIPQQTAVLPLEMLTYSPPMTFLQRLYNTLLTIYMHVRRKYEYLPKHETTAREMFGPDMPSLSLLERNFSLFLVNSVTPGLDPPRPLPPTVIEVGCLHCKSGSVLPQDVQEFLDGAENGAIYFSLGSNVPCEDLPSTTINVLLTVFSKLPQRVLWKWGGDKLPDHSKNVRMLKWLPQQDVLAHPNTKVFMTHGGRLSMLEALYHGVPVLVLPVFYDQYLHGHRAQELGWGLNLHITNVTESGLSTALHTILSTQRFRNTARSLSSLSKDQSQTSIQRALFWIDYCIRNNGTSHLRPADLDLSWYQLYLVDVACAILIIPSILLCYLTRKQCMKSTNRKPSETKSHKKQS